MSDQAFKLKADTFIKQPIQTTAISIHAPLAGSDPETRRAHKIPSEFLSTLPSRGATYRPRAEGGYPVFLSTLPSRGATRRSSRIRDS